MNENNSHILSCADCAVTNCIYEKGEYPSFCLTENLEENGLKDVLEEAMEEYRKPEINKLAVSAAEVETENYCRMNRMEETIEFAKKIGAKKIGIATCAGLISETRTAAKILRHKGFEVFGVACKCGTQKKVDIGVPEFCNATGENMCNPIFQAKYLNNEKTDLNILIGLCVGHDSLFYKYSDAPVTTLVSKDRVLAHNTVAALYQADKYFQTKYFSND